MGCSYWRRLPERGAVLRLGAKYYPLKPAYSPQGAWIGVHLTGAGISPRSEKTLWTGGMGIALGYQHIFRQAYGGSVEPYLLGEITWGKKRLTSPLQIGMNIGFAARRWERRNLR
uniref:DUF3575 domain-containing protein n=1 Tax=uncultured Bacteroidota bacterium TaxID=152509 RepID=H5SK38_9BACT|nr:hypothetical protein HGMM_F40B03C12 [uncultured Bacteroidetes bacterium]